MLPSALPHRFMSSPGGPLLTFHGHACFGLALPDGTHLCLDPVPEAGFAGHSTLRRLPDTFTHAVSSHAHTDHAAFHEVPSATPVIVPEGGVALGSSLRIEARLAPHDEYGGRLRGGLSAILRLTVTVSSGTPVCLVFAGDLGEVPSGALLAWLRAVPIDVLAVPVGGYYVLSPRGALETVGLLEPRVAVPVHAHDQGIPLPVMDTVAVFLRGWPMVDRAEGLDLEDVAADPRTTTRCVVLRPHAVAASPSE